MKRLLALYFLAVMLLLPLGVYANGVNAFPQLSQSGTSKDFPLFANGKSASIYTDANDFKVVQLTAQMLADDIQRVGGMKAQVLHASNLQNVREKTVVLAGTLGQSKLIDQVVAKAKINVNNIQGKWESFVVCTLKKPAKGIDQAFVIIGSDRRGTAFGIMSLCEAMGVSPWYWWADITPQHQDAMYIAPGTYQQGEPSVKFRGIFINDERFGGCARWAELTFDKEHGVMGPKTYVKVFELLLRLKGNYLWPAMHPGTQAFNADPENARLADDYAIVMGTSHCEQMLRNNEDEWKKVGIYGDFNYLTNRQTMLNYWEERIKTNGKYENTYTIGLRGIHDYPMEGATSNEERISIMQQAINDQRDILKRNINKDITEIPQVLCTYEEVLDAYHGGLQVPDDVTLLWSDDKQGYMRNLCNPSEQKRKGGAGIYYHLSYHGDPDSWFWLSPLSPGLISAELTKSYDYGANRIWVFNVGDIKPAEKELSLAMELAWNVNSWKPADANRFSTYWTSKTFGGEIASELADLQNRYYRLMAYGKEFHTRWLEYTDNEIDARLNEWNDLYQRVEILSQKVPQRLKAAYYELFTYPVQGAAMMNRYVLQSRRSRVLANNGDKMALDVTTDALKARDKVDELTRYYNEKLLDGKWDNFFNWHPNWYLDGLKEVMEFADKDLLEKSYVMPASVWIMPETYQRCLFKEQYTFQADKDGMMPLWIKARTRILNNSFDAKDNEYATISINETTLRASAFPHGNIWHTDTIGPMWSCVGEIPVKKGMNKLQVSNIVPNTRVCGIYAGIQPPFAKEPLLRIQAKDYIAKNDVAGATISTIPMLGYTDGVTTQPFQTPSFNVQNAPWVEYELTSGMHGTLEIRTLPTLRIYEGRDARYAVSIDGGTPQIFSIHEHDYSSEWRWNVLRGYTRRFIPLEKNANKVRIYLLDPAVTLQELLVIE